MKETKRQVKCTENDLKRIGLLRYRKKQEDNGSPQQEQWLKELVATSLADVNVKQLLI